MASEGAPWVAPPVCTTWDLRRSDPWFPVDELRPGAAEQGKLLCGLCPVLTRCFREVMALERGLRARHRFGVWAGLDPEERARLDESAGHRTSPPARARRSAQDCA
ncbi:MULTISPECIES: WhiB family transcriptional regulator [unclassified Isoptericola]|uniref:WhiB family transcriptional regulator n=1 Tax=Isoptericola sp. NPDC057191 TaxID=3346041 RepID=UPI003636B90E